LARVKKSARWKPRIIEKCLGPVRSSMDINIPLVHTGHGSLE
jgi:hypothetical protein